MNLSIRPADLETDRSLIIETLRRWLTPLSDGRRYDWLYRQVPFGPPRVWVALDQRSDKVIGMASAFPRDAHLDGRDQTVWVLGDFCVDEHYRSLGPALQLMRVFVEEGGWNSGTWYDFPSEAMMVVYKRLHLKASASTVRMAKPLRVDRWVKGLVKNARLASAVMAAGNMALKLRQLRFQRSSCTITSHSGAFDAEFTALAELRRHYQFCLRRSAEYLNWRYRNSPVQSYEVLTARRSGKLLAYAVFAQSGEKGHLVDLFGVNDHRVLADLIEAVAHLVRKRRAVKLIATVSESHPWLQLLAQSGFRAREKGPLVCYGLPSGPLGSRGWFFMQGDRDS